MSIDQNGYSDAVFDAINRSRGLHYGDGVFRTVLRHGGGMIDWALQIETLARDAEALGLDMPQRQQLAADAEALFGDASAGVLKILLWRAGESRGYGSMERRAESRLLRYPLPDFSADCWAQGIDAMRSPVVLSEQPLLAGIKHLNRLEQVLASCDWPAGVQEAIFVSNAGAPVCGTRSNLFWVRNGQLFTPQLARCGVSGMMRARILALAFAIGVEITIDELPLQALLDADEAFVCNSLMGLWPLRSFEGRRWAKPGAVTRRILRGLAHPLTPTGISD